MKEYNNFIALIEDSVLPLIKNNPEWIRLDGQNSGGNRKVFAKFVYNSKLWKIHSDTHIDKLILAFQIFDKGKDPFIETPTKKKKNTRLVIQNQFIENSKHIYIYQI